MNPQEARLILQCRRARGQDDSLPAMAEARQTIENLPDLIKELEDDAAFDALIGQRFGPLIARALIGDIDDWLTRPVDPLPALARVLVLDQFTRNVFRDTARAFAGDGAFAGNTATPGCDLTDLGLQRRMPRRERTDFTVGAHQPTRPDPAP